MPTSRPPSEKTVATLHALPVETLVALLDALSRGDLAAAVKAGGGGLRKAELAALLEPGGETGALLDGWEKRAFFQRSRTLGIALMAALPGAISTLAAISEGTALGDAEPMRDEHDDTQTQALRIAQTNMLPKVNEQRRLAALALFDLAQKLGLFDLAKGFRAPDIEADEEQELARMAAAQGLDYLPPLHTLITTEQPLRRVK